MALLNSVVLMATADKKYEKADNAVKYLLQLANTPTTRLVRGMIAALPAGVTITEAVEWVKSTQRFTHEEVKAVASIANTPINCTVHELLYRPYLYTGTIGKAKYIKGTVEESFLAALTNMGWKLEEL